jgi:hypothetical protein
MPRPNFFNDNINRTFPFKVNSAGVGTPTSGNLTDLKQIPDYLIADCGFIVGPGSGFLEGVHSIFLNSVYRDSSKVFFVFKCDAPGLVNLPLVFSRNLIDPLYTREFADSDLANIEHGSESETIEGCDTVFWSGYLVTGNLENVQDLFSADVPVGRTSPDATVIEPALIQNLEQNQVVSVSVANVDRTRSVRPGACPPVSWDFPTNQVYVWKECMVGNIQFAAGYNTALSQSTLNNTITISAVVGAGKGEPCQQVEIFPGETPPENSSNNLLEGDYYCNEVLRTVNGIAGPNLTLFAGTGVAIIPDSDNNKVVIDINLDDLSLCLYSEVSEAI